MSKKATFLWIDQKTIAGVVAPTKASPAISIDAGKMKILQVKMPQQEGWVNELVVKQATVANGGGTAVAFTVELLDSKGPYYLGADASNERPYTDAADLTIDLFRVLDSAKTAAAGGTVSVQSLDFGYPFYNADGPSHTDADKYLYLVIIPTNALTATKWEVSLTHTRDIMA